MSLFSGFDYFRFGLVCNLLWVAAAPVDLLEKPGVFVKCVWVSTPLKVSLREPQQERRSLLLKSKGLSYGLCVQLQVIPNWDRSI